MKILSLEFSSEQRSVAVVKAVAGVPIQVLGSAVDTGPRGSKALGAVDAALAEAKVGPEQIELVAVGLGPGSYNGIRVAIAVAQGWQFARNCKLIGISSVECLAAQAQKEGLEGQVAFLIDAQRNEFYLAVYEMLAGEARIVEPLHLATFAEATARLETCPFQVGPEVTRWFPGGRVMYPQARVLAELASQRTDFVSGEQLVPIYLRETTFVKAPPPRIIE